MEQTGLEAKKRGNYEAAERLYLAEAAAGDLLSMTNLGIMYWELGRLVEARAQFLRASEAGFPMAMWDLGNMYYEFGFVSHALGAWQESLPDQLKAYHSLLVHHSNRQQFAEALQAVNASIDAGVREQEGLELIEIRSELEASLEQSVLLAGADCEDVQRLIERDEELLGLVGENTLALLEMCSVRQQAAQIRPLSTSPAGSLFDSIMTISPIGGLGVPRPASETIPSKALLWAFAADAWASLGSRLYNEGAPPEEVVDAFIASSQALQESFALEIGLLPPEREAQLLLAIEEALRDEGLPAADLYAVLYDLDALHGMVD
jgi:tetratricopeptide (TPR) repeat protein